MSSVYSTRTHQFPEWQQNLFQSREETKLAKDDIVGPCLFAVYIKYSIENLRAQVNFADMASIELREVFFI